MLLSDRAVVAKDLVGHATTGNGHNNTNPATRAAAQAKTGCSDTDESSHQGRGTSKDEPKT